ncbi:MAG: hypothetical protein ACOCSD_07000 [Halolamina sp.]
MTDADDVPDTIGISATTPADKEIVAAFDAAFDCGPDGSNSRSEAIKRAMLVMTHVRPAIEDADLEFVSARDEAGFMRQAIYDRIRQESE